MSEQKLHFYALSFDGNTDSGEQLSVTTYRRVCDKRITSADIKSAVEYHGLKNYALIACSYLGFMTLSEFKGEAVNNE